MLPIVHSLFHVSLALHADKAGCQGGDFIGGFHENMTLHFLVRFDSCYYTSN